MIRFRKFSKIDTIKVTGLVDSLCSNPQSDWSYGLDITSRSHQLEVSRSEGLDISPLLWWVTVPTTLLGVRMRSCVGIVKVVRRGGFAALWTHYLSSSFRLADSFMVEIMTIWTLTPYTEFSRPCYPND